MDRDLLITRSDSLYGLNVLMSGDDEYKRPVRDECSKAHSRCLNSAIHLATERYDGALSLWTLVQLLDNLSCIETFPGEKLDDWSILDIQHFLEIKTNSSSNFASEGKEPIGRKLLYVNKNASYVE